MTASRSHDSTLAYYESHAAEYAAATEPISMASFTSRFAALLPYRAPVLDLGCGSGRDLRALTKLGLRCTGLDLSPTLAIRAARYSGCPVVVGDMRALPFQNGNFTGIWASASLLHLPRADLSGGLAECRRVLRDGGIFFSSMKLGRGEGYDTRGRWFSYVTQPEWVSLLEQAGFFVLTTEQSSVPGEQDHPWSATFARVPQ
jgi:SAM-dependent methyltransferase